MIAFLVTDVILLVCLAITAIATSRAPEPRYRRGAQMGA